MAKVRRLRLVLLCPCESGLFQYKAVFKEAISPREVNKRDIVKIQTLCLTPSLVKRKD